MLPQTNKNRQSLETCVSGGLRCKPIRKRHKAGSGAFYFVLLALLVMLAATACTRSHYRQAADQEAYCLIGEKSADPRWHAPRYDIALDAQSRYYDSTNPDCPPMPQDDPTAHSLMHCVDGKKGWKYWHQNGVRSDLENPSWQLALGDYVDLDESGAVKLDIDSALRLAYVHSPNHQTQLETLYLSALDVSRERFRLDTQFFGGSAIGYSHNGDLTPAGINSVSPGPFGITGPFVNEEGNRFTLGRTTAGDPTFRGRRAFATAGEFVAGFANSFVIEFTGPEAGIHSSLLNFALSQPLLRGAGRDIALEQLTFFERILLANLRSYAQFRHGFYTQVAIGEAGVVGPQRNGRSTSLQIFGGQGGVNGFVGLLRQLQLIRNAEDNLDLQVRTLTRLETLLAGGLIDLVQVDQFRQNVENERANLLSLRNNYQNALDRYKTGVLGLPPDLPLALEDELIQQFQIVGREATDLRNRISDILLLKIGKLSVRPPGQELVDLTDEEILAVMVPAFQEILALDEPIREQLEICKQDVERLIQSVSPMDVDLSEADNQLLQEERGQLLQSIDEQSEVFETLRTRIDELDQVFAELSSVDAGEVDGESEGIQRNGSELAAVDSEGVAAGSGAKNRRAQKSKVAQAKDDTINLLSSLTKLVQTSILVQARARLDVVMVDDIELDPKQAFGVALANRLDFMNGRARLVDDWRQIQIAADALQSTLDLTVNGNMRTARNNPISFDPQASNINLGLRFDAPFTRLLERNTYRESLINYQRSRRNFIQSRDSLHLGLRVLLREVERLRESLEIQRRAVAIAIRRVDVTSEQLFAPVRPPQPGQRPLSFGPTATFNLISAQRALLDTQNSFLNVWLSYYAAKMRLYRELGIMNLASDGRWVETPLPVAREAVLQMQLDAEAQPGLIEEVEALEGIEEAMSIPPAVAEELILTVNSLPEDFAFDVIPPASGKLVE
ncbi:MAG: TolC family protein [Pirellulaceae bacterium]